MADREPSAALHELMLRHTGRSEAAYHTMLEEVLAERADLVNAAGAAEQRAGTLGLRLVEMQERYNALCDDVARGFANQAPPALKLDDAQLRKLLTAIRSRG